MALLCLGCGRRGRDPAYAGRCSCGALSWVETSPAPPRRSPPRSSRPAPPPPTPSPPRPPEAPPPAPAIEHARPSARLLRLSETTERMIVHPYDASELARVLHGIREAGTVILAGEAGAGKSTVAAELAAAVAEARQGLSYWLDRDQQAHDLIAALFSRVQAPMDRVVLVEERDASELTYEPLTWMNALAQVPSDAACVVIDSLETWASTYGEQAALARAVSGHEATVKLVLAGTNATGDVEGIARLRRVGDAVVVLDAESWFVRKCRWLPDCPQRFPRERRVAAQGAATDDEPPVLH